MLDVTNRENRASEPPRSSGDVLTAQQVADYRDKGWVLARGFVAPAAVEMLARWTDELTVRPEEPGKHMVYYEPSLTEPGKRVIQRIENFCPHHVGFDAFVHGRELRQAVDQLLAAPACLFKDKINFKMPGGAGFEPHQDQQAGWSRYARMFVTALVTIDRATIETGCLEMGDGARVIGLIGEEWRPLAAAEMTGFSLVPVPTEPGDVLFFDSYAPHASKPNMTDRARRILYLTYNAAAEGDFCKRYFTEKRDSFPPDIERAPGVEYRFRV
ncbi:MAG TPA: phytanoyl-CoA dioxygenase family protein [Stellaceae bacterium]|nr:phytanoyl-CoA dioxygenase family protein [Stellaceae bacterium]